MGTENPWRTLDQLVVYRNPWITVREDRVIRPDGKEGIYGVVESRIATGVIALNEQEEVCLVGQYRYAMEEYSWEIVEGGADEGESPLAAAQRELQEEAGLAAAQWEQLGDEIHLSNCHSSERGHLYVATGLRAVEASPEGTEALEVRMVPLSKVYDMVDCGEIKDAMTIMAVLRLFRQRFTSA